VNSPPAIAPIPWPDFSYRLGLLVASALFFVESVGLPSTHGLFGFAAGALAMLLVLTPAASWRCLGDWREIRRRILLGAMMFVAWIPLAAAVTPRLGKSAIPDALEGPMMAVISFVRGMPFGTWMANLGAGLVSFAILFFTLVCMMLAWKPGRVSPLLAAATLLSALLLFFNPTIEVAIGLLFLGMFVHESWEPALILPMHLTEALSPAQRDFLLYLRTNGAVTAAETPLLLRGTEKELADILELGLAAYDPATKTVHPGERLFLESAGGSIDRAMFYGTRVIWILLGSLYFLFPDLLPGPIDDVIIMALCTWAGLRMPGRPTPLTFAASAVANTKPTDGAAR
jgi:hypothetical protein